LTSIFAGKIRGAGLDVFYEEPLPADSRLYKLDNVLMSPHCADRTKDFQFSSLEMYVQKVKKYVAGEGVENPVDKHAGY
jgi:phosphoglycerate dehydrogenase-like enzyme